MVTMDVHIQLHHIGTTYLNTLDYLGTSELSRDCSKHTTSDWPTTPKDFPKHKY